MHGEADVCHAYNSGSTLPSRRKIEKFATFLSQFFSVHVSVSG